MGLTVLVQTFQEFNSRSVENMMKIWGRKLMQFKFSLVAIVGS